MSTDGDHGSSNREGADGHRLIRECPVCQTPYRAEQITILNETEDARLVHVTCGQCLHAMMAMLILSEFGMSSLGIMTDLSLKDAEHAMVLGPIEEDDVLNFHLLVGRGRAFTEHVLPGGGRRITER